MAGHAAIVRCAIFVRFAKIKQFAKKNLRSILQKLIPFSAFFLRLVNFPLSKLGNQIVIIDYQSVISKKGGLKTIGVRNSHVCESA